MLHSQGAGETKAEPPCCYIGNGASRDLKFTQTDLFCSLRVRIVQHRRVPFQPTTLSEEVKSEHVMHCRMFEALFRLIAGGKPLLLQENTYISFHMN